MTPCVDLPAVNGIWQASLRLLSCCALYSNAPYLLDLKYLFKDSYPEITVNKLSCMYFKQLGEKWLSRVEVCDCVYCMSTGLPRT